MMFVKIGTSPHPSNSQLVTKNGISTEALDQG